MSCVLGTGVVDDSPSRSSVKTGLAFQKVGDSASVSGPGNVFFIFSPVATGTS